MSKATKTVWCCRECGHSQTKWSGQCYSCKEWNTFEEEVEVAPRYEEGVVVGGKAVRIHEVVEEERPRLTTQMAEFDRMLGGGLMRGSLSLVGGEPGIGKSTLLLQVSQAVASQGLVVLYVCGEESVAQTSQRARRLGISHSNLLLLSERNLSVIKRQIEEIKPDFVIIDSIQIIYKQELPASPGSVSQVRECATELMHLAKSRALTILIIGHVTKSGEIAGPRLLEHLVDTVLYFEGERQHHYRLLRVVKHRFGSTEEIAVFQMGEKGLQEITNPSQLFLEERSRGNPGSVIIPTIEGSRPILVEVQALVTDTVYSTPSRRCTGIESNRLALLLAVMEKKMGYPLHNRDIFVSLAGGMKIVEPAIDLGVVLAIASSLTNRSLDPEMVVVGEVGLGGDLRSVPRIEARLKEAAHMGFTKAMIPKKGRNDYGALSLLKVERVEEALRLAFR